MTLTIYDQFCQIAADASHNRAQRQQTMTEAFVEIIDKFNEYCRIPPNRIRYYRCNGLPTESGRTFQPSRTAEEYTPAKAIWYDEEQDEWNIALELTLPNNVLATTPVVTFALFLRQVSNKITVRLGPNQDLAVDPRNQIELFHFCNSLVEQIKDGLSRDSKKQAKHIGFTLNP